MVNRESKEKPFAFDRLQEIGVTSIVLAFAQRERPLSFTDIEPLVKRPEGGEAMSSILLYKAGGFEFR